MALDITQQIAMVTRLHPKGMDFNIFGHIYKGPINQLYTFTAYTIRLLCLDNEYSQNHYLYSLPADKVLFPNIDLLFSKYWFAPCKDCSDDKPNSMNWISYDHEICMLLQYLLLRELGHQSTHSTGHCWRSDLYFQRASIWESGWMVTKMLPLLKPPWSTSVGSVTGASYAWFL